MSKVDQAMVFAVQAHLGQFRDDGKTPFIVHPATVVGILKTVTDDEDVLAAAWLHDVIEDTDITADELEAEFGERITQLVLEVTHEGTRNTGYYFPRLHSQEAIMIKFADRLSNISDMKSWDRPRRWHYLRKSRFWSEEPKTGRAA